MFGWNRRKKGQAAEKRAVAFLRSEGYRIVATNYTCSVGELDIIARQGDELVFVEVRSRKSSRYGDAVAAVDQNKQRQVARVAQAYLSQKAPKFHTSRFDIIGITGDSVEHLIDAFRVTAP